MRIYSHMIGLLLAMLWLAPGWAAIPQGVKPDDFVDSTNAVIIEAIQDRQRVRPGETMTIGLLTIPYSNDDFHFHIYGVEPSSAGYIPSTWMMNESEIATFGEPVWPPAHVEESPIGTMYWLMGQNVATMEVTINPDTAPGEYELTGSLFFMACTPEMCLAPSKPDFSWKIEVLAADDPTEVLVDRDVFLQERYVDYVNDFSLPVEETEDEDDAALAASGTEDDGSWLLAMLKDTRADKDPIPFANIFLLALAGGLILNIMPCVLPVVSIKVISLVKSAHEDPKQIWGHGFAFAGGIMAAFGVLALIITILQGIGKGLGWGFQFQNPWFVLAMVTIIFVFGLSLAGVFTIKPPEAVTHAGEQLAESETIGGSFFKGALATVLGTPCVGPFLGPALGVAFTTDASWKVFMIFFAIGIGMAIPYIIMLPFLTRMGRRQRGQLSRKLVESKDKLVMFERVMAFLMFFTAVYLLSILAGIGGTTAVIWTLVYLTGLAMAAWLWGEMVQRGPRAMRLGGIFVLLIVGLSGWFGLRPVIAAAAQATMTPEAQQREGVQEIDWEPFSIAALEGHLQDRETVFVDFTADWCPNCKTNEAVALNVPSTQAFVAREGIVMMQADWTVENDEIKAMVNALGFASIPLVGIFPAGDPGNPIVVDALYSASGIQERMREALER